VANCKCTYELFGDAGIDVTLTLIMAFASAALKIGLAAAWHGA